MPAYPDTTGPAQHALQRSLTWLVRSVPERVEKKRRSDAIDGLREREQQFQIVIAGTAAARIEKAEWTEFELKFELEFPEDAFLMRDADFDVPTYTRGVWIKSATPVAVFDCVKSFVKRQDGGIIGAKLNIAAVALGQPKGAPGVPFQGELHVSFQGYAAPTEIQDGSQQDDAVEDEPLPPTP